MHAFSLSLSSASLTHTDAACQLVVKDTFSQDKQNSIQKLQQHQTYIYCISSRFTRPGNLCLLFASDMQAWQVFQSMHVPCSDMHLCALQCWHWRKASPSKTQMMPSVCEHSNFGAHECYGKKTKTLGSFCHILDVFSCTSCYVRDEKRWKDGDRKRDGCVWAFSPVDCLFSSCAFMFQGPAGTKGDKGERVSLSTVLQLFRANPVLLVLFCCGNTVIFAEVKLLTITH